MNNSNYRIVLDIHTLSSQAMLDVKKDDTARQFNFILSDGGKPYVIEEGCTAVFRAKKPDGTILYNDCTIEDNTIIYRLTSQTSNAIGIIECEVTLYGSDSHQITSPRFTLRVEDTIYSDSEVESQDEFTALTTAIAEANNLDISSQKSGKITRIEITHKDGTKSIVTVGDGQDGINIISATINSAGHLIITLSNGQTIDAGRAKGDKGDPGSGGGGDVPEVQIAESEDEPVEGTTKLYLSMEEEEDDDLVVDEEPTEDSPNLVTSGGVKSYIDNFGQAAYEQIEEFFEMKSDLETDVKEFIDADYIQSLFPDGDEVSY